MAAADAIPLGEENPAEELCDPMWRLATREGQKLGLGFHADDLGEDENKPKDRPKKKKRKRDPAATAARQSASGSNKTEEYEVIIID